MREAVKLWRPNVYLIYGYTWPGAWRLILGNYLKKRPQIHRGTLNTQVDPRQPLRSAMMRSLRILILRMFNAHHFGGVVSERVLVNSGVTRNSMFFVPYSVDTPHFLSGADNPENIDKAKVLRTSLDACENEPVILFLAQHNWFKGPDIALKAMHHVQQMIPTAKFLIAGSGRMTHELKSFANENLIPNSYRFTGYISSKETVPLYLASDIVICTSRYETWGRMFNEAMACRRVCVTNSNVPVANDMLVHNVSGIIVTEQAPESYANAIARFTAFSASKKREMGECARQKAIEFSYDAQKVQILESINYALEVRQS
jgi:glycosyltransferase involved in cell wall biosynthesis